MKTVFLLHKADPHLRRNTPVNAVGLAAVHSDVAEIDHEIRPEQGRGPLSDVNVIFRVGPVGFLGVAVDGGVGTRFGMDVADQGNGDNFVVSFPLLKARQGKIDFRLRPAGNRFESALFRLLRRNRNGEEERENQQRKE